MCFMNIFAIFIIMHAVDKINSLLINCSPENELEMFNEACFNKPELHWKVLYFTGNNSIALRTYYRVGMRPPVPDLKSSFVFRTCRLSFADDVRCTAGSRFRFRGLVTEVVHLDAIWFVLISLIAFWPIVSKILSSAYFIHYCALPISRRSFLELVAFHGVATSHMRSEYLKNTRMCLRRLQKLVWDISIGVRLSYPVEGSSLLATITGGGDPSVSLCQSTHHWRGSWTTEALASEGQGQLSSRLHYHFRDAPVFVESWCRRAPNLVSKRKAE